MPLFAAALAALQVAAPADLAASRAEADAVIRAASAQKHFTNDTNRALPAARHNDSGLRCLFQPKAAGNQIVYIGSVGPGGHGMGCLSRPAGLEQRLSATRMPPGRTLDDVFPALQLNITFQRPEARPYEGQGPVVRIEPGFGARRAPLPRTSGYIVGPEGDQRFSRVSAAVVGEWLIVHEMQAPAARADEAELLAGVVMSTALIDLATRAAKG